MGKRRKKTKERTVVKFLSKNKSKHDKIITRLEEKLGSHMDSMYHNVEYHKPQGNVIGEIDLITYNERTNTLYLFEVKSNYSYKGRGKARRQLERACYRFVPRFWSRHFNENAHKIVTVYVNGHNYDKGYDCECMGVYDISY